MAVPGAILLDVNGSQILDSSGKLFLSDALGNTCCCGTTYLQCRKCCDGALANIWVTAAQVPPSHVFKYKGLCYSRTGTDPSSSDPSGKTVVTSGTTAVDNCGVSACDTTTGYHLTITGISTCNGCHDNVNPNINNSVNYESIPSGGSEDLALSTVFPGVYTSGVAATWMSTAYPTSRGCSGEADPPYIEHSIMSFNPGTRGVGFGTTFFVTLPSVPTCANPKVSATRDNPFNRQCGDGSSPYSLGGTATLELGIQGSVLP